MAIPLIVNGVTFQYPQQFDKNWGPTLTNWSSAVTSGMLQKAGGSFPLTAEVDFGGSFGMKVLSIKSQESNIATTGVFRLANASTGIVWRNALHNANLALTVNSSNQLTFNGTSIGATTSLTDGHILVGNVSNQPADVAMSGDVVITNAGVTAISSGVIVNADISASAAIALTKLAPSTAYYWYAANASAVLTPLAVTASRAVVTDSNGLPAAATTTATEIGYVNGVTSAIQTQIDTKLSKSGGTMSGVLNMGSNKIVSLAQGTSTGEAIAYPVGTSQITSGVILQCVEVAADPGGHAIGVNSVDTITITTTGGKVLLDASASLAVTASTQMGLVLTISKDSATTSLPGGYSNTSVFGQGVNTGNISVHVTCSDTPVAGTYTYKLRYGINGTGSAVTNYNFRAMELKV